MMMVSAEQKFRGGFFDNTFFSPGGGGIATSSLVFPPW